jgi:hypothetical protein
MTWPKLVGFFVGIRAEIFRWWAINSTFPKDRQNGIVDFGVDQLVALPKYISELVHAVACHEDDEQLIVLPEHIAAEGRVPGELVHAVACYEDDEQLIVLPEHIAAEGRVLGDVGQLIVLPEHIAAEGRVPGELAHVVAGHKAPDIGEFHCLCPLSSQHLSQNLL